jgi:transposase
MFLRTTTQKRKDGSTLTHAQLAESLWDKDRKRSDTRVIYNCGRADDPQVIERLRRLARSILRRYSPEEIVADGPGWKLVDAWPYGDVYALEAIWKRLGFPEVLDKILAGRHLSFRVERAVFAMVANRACAPCSKLYCYEQWLREDTRIEGATGLELHHFYRAMDLLAEHTEAIEEELYYRLCDLLRMDVDLVFYDTTSLHFEVDEEDDPGLRKRGYSKNKRHDQPQVVVGLAVTRDGLPVKHWVFPGNTVDVSTVERVKQDLGRWKLSRCVFVGDAGMVSQENLRKLSLGGGKYIVSMPAHRGGEVVDEVIKRAGRYREVAQNLRVKEVIVGDGERRRRYVVCHNPEEAVRQRKHRERLIAMLQAELEALADLDPEVHNKRVCALVANRRFGRFLRQTNAGKPALDQTALREAEKLDGKFVVHTNDDTLSAEDVALGYKQLMRVEQCWRQLKGGLRMRPVYHYKPERIRAHIAISVHALLLERVAECACKDTWRNIRDDLRQVKLAQLSSPDGEVWQVTEPRQDAAKRLKSLGLKNPAPVRALV